MLDFFQHSLLLVRTVPDGNYGHSSILAVRHLVSLALWGRVIFEGQSQVTVALCGNYHRHPGREESLSTKASTATDLCLGWECDAQLFPEVTSGVVVSRFTVRSPSATVCHSWPLLPGNAPLWPHSLQLPSFPSCVPAGPSQPASPSKLVRFFNPLKQDPLPKFTGDLLAKK